jgi:hypothetical protein
MLLTVGVFYSRLALVTAEAGGHHTTLIGNDAMLSSNNLLDALHCLPADGLRNTSWVNVAFWPASVVVFAWVAKRIWSMLIAQLHALSVQGVRIVTLLDCAMLLCQSINPAFFHYELRTLITPDVHKSTRPFRPPSSCLFGPAA